MKEEKDECCNGKNAQVEKEKLDHHTDDKNESEKETAHNKENDGHQN